MSEQVAQPKLHVRASTLADVDGILRIAGTSYIGEENYTRDEIAAQIRQFPDGHMVAVFDGEIVGYCASIVVHERRALGRHTWRAITGNGYGSTHDPDGDWLYGYEVVVDSSARGQRIGQRLYTARRQLCARLGLKGIAFGGRIPGFARSKFDDPAEYIGAVAAKRRRDTVLSFQLRNGFDVIGVLRGYDKTDKDSGGHAAHLVWRNPDVKDGAAQRPFAHDRPAGTVRVASVQYLQRAISSFDEFERIVGYFIDTVAEKRCDFVIFPEYFTVQLLSLESEKFTHLEAIKKLATYAPQVRELLQRLAIKYNVNIIGGSHPVLETVEGVERVLNVCYVCLRDGSVHEQHKLHPTPGERYDWQIEGSSGLQAIDTDCGPIGVNICYDSEFPEMARHLTDQGARILFIPFSTEERHGYLRVRYCAQARAVENQIYTVTAGNVGNLPRYLNMDIHYAQSGIYTPCDVPFARDGVAADTTPNVEMIAFADLNLDALEQARSTGTVQNLKDRRHDLYSVKWADSTS